MPAGGEGAIRSATPWLLVAPTILTYRSRVASGSMTALFYGLGVTSQPPAIEARSLTKTYGRARARGIVAVDLVVAPGEVLGLVGANGAGKTTFMRTLLDFIRPSSGSLSVLGHDSVRDSVAVRKLATYLPGELVIPPRLTGDQTLQRFAFARPRLDPGRVAALADRLNLDLSRRIGDLSKGNKQKVGLVLAFAPRAQLLVLDEPTSGLDPLLQREFAALAREATADGTTILLSSHVMSEVEQMASRVALMREGRIALVGDVAEISVKARRRGRVRPRDPVDLEPLVGALRVIGGVSEVAIDGDVVVFACSGDMDDVLKAVSRFPVHALDVAHTDLEDAFLEILDGPDPCGGAR
jgi:ABC-2 type transport system ATP-binding protein